MVNAAPQWPAIEAVVESVAGSRPMWKQRVRLGQSNAVFDVTLEDGRRVAARTRHGSAERYRIEEAAMSKAREADVPVPGVLGIAEVPGQAVMVSEWIDGQPLLGAANAERSRDRRALAIECGRLLTAVHAVELGGYGNVDATLRGSHGTFDEWFIDGLHERLEAVADDSPASDLLTRVLDRLEVHRALLREASPRFNHGDFSPSNVVVRDGRVVGLVDWESVKSGPPALDLGWWDWLAGTSGVPFPADWMRATATESDLALRALVRLRICAGHVLWTADRSRAAHKEAVRQLETALREG